MITYQELKKQAEIILLNEPSGEFTDKSFSCRSGGSPGNKMGLPEVFRSDTFKYDTVRNGGAYSGEVVIRCRSIGAVDINGKEIFEADGGMLFVYHYHRGSPEHFDGGFFREPQMAI